MKSLSILFVGQLYERGRSMQRYRALQRLGCGVTPCSTTPVDLNPDGSTSSLAERFFWKIGFPLDRLRVNSRIRRAVDRVQFDIVWIEKGVGITPGTLRYVRKRLPDTVLISCSEDDMFARHNRSWYYTWGLPLYDLVFTTKQYNLTELKNLGAKRTSLFLDAFDPVIHTPRTLVGDQYKLYSCDVVFVGTYERARGESLLHLAQSGVSVTVWGDGWSAFVGRSPFLSIRGRAVYNEEYANVLSGAKIALCFLRKMNRDETTSRSVEIPACGSCMVAERTSRHEGLFDDGTEALFFQSNDELVQLVKRFLVDSHARISIAKSGRERCVRSGYEHDSQMRHMLSEIESLRIPII